MCVCVCVCVCEKFEEFSLQTNLDRNSLNFSYISFFSVNFENLTVKFHVFYILTCILNLVQIRCYLLFD